MEAAALKPPSLRLAKQVSPAVASTFGTVWLWAFLSLFPALLSPLPAAWAEGPVARIYAVHDQKAYAAGVEHEIWFQVEITPPWMLHGPEEAAGMSATRLEFPAAGPVVVKDIRLPPPSKIKFPYLAEEVTVYKGIIDIPATLWIAGHAQPGEYILEGRLSYQACTSQVCLAPEIAQMPLKVIVKAAAAPPAGKPAESAPPRARLSPSADAGIAAGTDRWEGQWLTLLAIFFGGMALNLTPCVYPLLPITVSYFGGRSGSMAGHPAWHALFFIVGLALTNSALGAAASLSGGLMGGALQHPVTLVIVALVLVLLATSFFGFWSLHLPSGLITFAARGFRGYPGTLFMGLTMGIVAAPCLGPFILGLLTIVAQKGDPLVGVVYFLVLSVGLGLPLGLLGIFSGALHRLPVSGDWMVWIRKLLGWLLVATALYMLQPLFSDDTARILLNALVITAAAIHLGWADSSGRQSRSFTYCKRLFALACLLGGVIYVATALKPGDGVAWTPYDTTLVEQAVREERPVLLDFYADWCIPCRKMETSTFTDPEVMELARHFTLLRVDLTTRHPEQAELQEIYGLKGVPTLIFIDRRGKQVEALRIEAYLEGPELAERMRLALR